jgi:hypothetical protein
VEEIYIQIKTALQFALAIQDFENKKPRNLLRGLYFIEFIVHVFSTPQMV